MVKEGMPMDVGELQIPKFTLELDFAPQMYRTPLSREYERIVVNTEIGKQVVAALESDPRVVRLKGELISQASSGQPLNTHLLAMWYLWYEQEHSSEETKKCLDTFLDSDTIQLNNTLWVLGIEVEEPISLAGGITIQPDKAMPYHFDKERFARRLRMIELAPSVKEPTCGLTCLGNVKKVIDPRTFRDEDKEYWAANRRMHDLAFLLNALDNVSCIPYSSTSYPSPSVPYGPFLIGGAGFTPSDFLGRRKAKLSSSDRTVIEELISGYDSLSETERTRMQLILYRIMQAKRGTRIEDRILDLGIALEMLLLQDNRNNVQLSLSFRIRGSWLVGTSKEDRLSVYQQLKEIYDYRCQVAHSGVLCNGKAREIQKVEDSFPRYEALAGRICRKLLTPNKPDWDNLVLDAN
jgi:hypothetical protein